MEHTQEKITNALKIIQDTCKAQESIFLAHPCDKCPLSIDSVCVLQDQPPVDWKINTKPPTIWKAFE